MLHGVLQIHPGHTEHIGHDRQTNKRGVRSAFESSVSGKCVLYVIFLHGPCIGHAVDSGGRVHASGNVRFWLKKNWVAFVSSEGFIWRKHDIAMAMTEIGATTENPRAAGISGCCIYLCAVLRGTSLASLRNRGRHGVAFALSQELILGADLVLIWFLS